MTHPDSLTAAALARAAHLHPDPRTREAARDRHDPKRNPTSNRLWFIAVAAFSGLFGATACEQGSGPEGQLESNGNEEALVGASSPGASGAAVAYQAESYTGQSGCSKAAPRS
jgi:hypothetical protein